METLKQEAIQVISKLPESANIDDIMYELYVIDKIKKGIEAAERGEVISTEDLKKEGDRDGNGNGNNSTPIGDLGKGKVY